MHLMKGSGSIHQVLPLGLKSYALVIKPQTIGFGVHHVGFGLESFGRDSRGAASSAARQHHWVDCLKRGRLGHSEQQVATPNDRFLNLQVTDLEPSFGVLEFAGMTVP